MALLFMGIYWVQWSSFSLSSLGGSELARTSQVNEFPSSNFYGSSLCLGSYCKLSLFLFLGAGHSAFDYTDRKEKKEA